MRSAATQVTWPVGGVAASVGVWWVLTTPLGVQPYLLPAPQDVATVGMSEFPRLAGHMWVTGQEVAIGFAAAAVGGIAVGVLFGGFRPVVQALMPVLVFVHAIPKLPLGVALVVVFGFGQTSKVIMVVLVCAFPVVLATSIGVTRTPVELVELARSLCAGRIATFCKIRLPAALPHIFTGLKQAAPLAVIGAVVGELFGAVAGLGYLIRGAAADTALVWAALLLLGTMALALYYIVAAGERLLAPWVRHTTA